MATCGQVFYILDRSAEEILKENREAIWSELLKKVDAECSDADNIPANLDKIRGKRIKNYLQFYSDAFSSRKYSVVLKHTAESASSLAPLIDAAYAKAIDVLKSQAVKTFATGPDGEAKIKNLKARTYYICGVRKDTLGSQSLEYQDRFEVG